MFPLKPLTTTDGEAVEVIDTGLQNSDAGPDFFNAKVRIGGTVWVGNVEIHEKSSYWKTHGHDKDSAYDNVVLHVAEVIDADVVTAGGRRVAQMQMSVPQDMTADYEALLSEDRYPPCHAVIPLLDRLTAHAWMSRLLAERLERKTADIARRVDACGGSWEGALFVTLARNYGFGLNGDAFERWAMSIPLTAAGRHRDDLLQTEALFMGQAGLLEPSAVPERYLDKAMREGYLERLRGEYAFLRHKFGLTPIDGRAWKFMRMRPQNFPHIRISQLASLYHSRRTDVSRLVECNGAAQMRALLRADATPYWETHYTFGSSGGTTHRSLSAASLDVIIINTAVPVLFAYGRHRGDEAMCSRALDIISQLKPERNRIVRLWNECSLKADSAADSQALIQLKTVYCDRKDCLRCRIGYEYLKKVKR